MRIPARLTIRAKILTVTVTLFIAAMVPTALRTSWGFERAAKSREEDFNRAQAEARANEISVILEKVAEKVSFYGPLVLKDTQSELVRRTFETDPDLVALRVYAMTAGAPQTVAKLVNTGYLKGYNLNAAYLTQLDKDRPFPVRDVFAGAPAIRNRSLKGKAPILTVGIPLAKDDVGRVSHVAVADVRFAAIQKAFADKRGTLMYLVDRRGIVVAHPDEALALGETSQVKNGIVKAALESKFAVGQQQYVKPETKEAFIGAFAKTRYDMIVISEASLEKILEPAAEARRMVFLITFVAIFGALFFISILALTITRPIERLVAATQEIRRGNFGLRVAKMVGANDEVGKLAISFDGMLAGLRERDKVKSLFSKFHGSSVTENLLASETVATGGTRKKVVIFFSDVRGFTAASETMTPEQVVSMLNEYFTIMVAIILKHHGIVDKFIGDAIMAVWGAPKSTGMDEEHAVAACLEMRTALAELNAKRASRNEPPIKIGIGLHAGDAVSGNIGSEERMEYTVIGDAVNMASRIEASTKAFGADLLVSDTVVQAVQGKFVTELAGKAKVKGKTEALALHKVRGRVLADGTTELIRTEFSDYEAEHAEKVEIAS